MRTLVLIPAYNESKNILSVIQSIKFYNYDILVVDDGSDDDTFVLSQNSGVAVLRHIINRGQGSSIKTGIRYALNNNYDVVVFFDADGQMQASEIEKIIEPLLLEKYEVVLGSRFLGQVKNLHFTKLIVLKLALVFTKILTGLKLTDVHNGFQCWSREALMRLDLTQDRMAYASELLNEIKNKKLKYKEIPVTITYNEYGQSVWNSFGILWDLFIKKYL